VRQEMKAKIIRICDSKIASKGSHVGLSFYAFLLIKMTIQNCLWKLRTGGLWK
jgi:hypothetical protein